MMRNKKAKAIRREVYGDMAHRGREYQTRGVVRKKMRIVRGRVYEFLTGQRVADPLRRQYQAAKKAAKGSR